MQDCCSKYKVICMFSSYPPAHPPIRPYLRGQLPEVPLAGASPLFVHPVRAGAGWVIRTLGAHGSIHFGVAVRKTAGLVCEPGHAGPFENVGQRAARATGEIVGERVLKECSGDGTTLLRVEFVHIAPPDNKPDNLWGKNKRPHSTSTGRSTTRHFVLHLQNSPTWRPHSPPGRITNNLSSVCRIPLPGVHIAPLAGYQTRHFVLHLQNSPTWRPHSTTGRSTRPCPPSAAGPPSHLHNCLPTAFRGWNPRRHTTFRTD